MTKIYPRIVCILNTDGIGDRIWIGLAFFSSGSGFTGPFRCLYDAQTVVSWLLSVVRGRPGEAPLEAPLERLRSFGPRCSGGSEVPHHPASAIYFEPPSASFLTSLPVYRRT